MTRPAADTLADFFATDVQDYRPAQEAISHAVASAKPGHVAAPIHGNVYTLTITADHARIVNARDPSIAAVEFPLAEFAAAFHRWTGQHSA